MPPKAAEKKPSTAGKAPAGKAPEKKEAGKKTTAAGGEKKKRSKTRKETYSSYIYKGMLYISLSLLLLSPIIRRSLSMTRWKRANAFFPFVLSPQASPPRYWYLKPRHVHPQFFRQWYVASFTCPVGAITNSSPNRYL